MKTWLKELLPFLIFPWLLNFNTSETFLWHLIIKCLGKEQEYSQKRVNNLVCICAKPLQNSICKNKTKNAADFVFHVIARHSIYGFLFEPSPPRPLQCFKNFIC